jgi:hypothetical protein
MSTRFDLEYPYNTKWKNGYLVINGEGRKHVCLVGGSKRSTTSYARYLMAVSLKRLLTEDEVVDHKDDDKTNDVLGNFQILTVRLNNLKEAKRRGRTLAEICCPSCKVIFTRRVGNTQAVPSKKGSITCCSRACSYQVLRKSYSHEERKRISEGSLLRVFSHHE